MAQRKVPSFHKQTKQSGMPSQESMASEFSGTTICTIAQTFGTSFFKTKCRASWSLVPTPTKSLTHTKTSPGRQGPIIWPESIKMSSFPPSTKTWPLILLAMNFLTHQCGWLTKQQWEHGGVPTTPTLGEFTSQWCITWSTWDSEQEFRTCLLIQQCKLTTSQPQTASIPAY